MPKRNLPIARKDELVIRELEDETLVYDYRTCKAYCLNQTASLIWKSCNGRNEPAAIARLLEREFQTPVREELVWSAIKQFTKDNLLEERPSLSKLADGVSRREIIRRIGLTTAIALPVVVSLVAPSPAMAASGCTCKTPGDCITQTSCPSTVNCNPSFMCAP
jgi:Coenzyme PQQ synthesis protein D (PqqD)